VLHQIGIGTLGPVFRTYEPTRDRLVAVKAFRLDIVPEQAQALAAGLSRATQASLFHPSIVEPIEAGVEGTVAYRAEEYVAAESLDVAMRHYAPAPIEKVLPFMTQLAGAIDFARAAGIGHGGLHPRDIFVTPDEARATGFGVVDALEQVGIRAPIRRPYSAPERIDGRAWSTQADVFSLAAITFELLTGKRPSGTGAQIGVLPDGDHAAEVHGVLARAMEEYPAERYATALAFVSALEAASQGRRLTDAVSVVTAIAAAPSAHPPPPPERAVPPVRAAKAPDSGVLKRKNRKSRVAAPPPQDAVPPPAESLAIAAAPVPGEFEVEAALDPVHEAIGDLAGRDASPAPVSAPSSGRRDAPPDGSLFDDDDFTATAAAEAQVEERFALLDEEPDNRTTAALEHAHTGLDDEPLGGLEDDRTGRPDDEARGKQDDWKILEDEGPVEAAMFHTGDPDHGPLEDPDRGRPAILPFAVFGILMLLVGFAGGYFVGSRDRVPPGPDTRETSSAPTGTVAPAASSAATPAGRATAETPGRYSEQRVAPPASPRGGSPAPVAAAPAAGAASTPRGTAPAATKGQIVVRSQPSHAGVTVNGQWRGRTPLTIENLAFGTYVIRIVQGGYRVAREEFTLSAHEPSRTLTMRLEPAAPAAPAPAAPAPSTPAVTTGSLYVDSRPRGASVSVDGRSAGQTPLTLPDVTAGTHVVRIEMEGKKPVTANPRVVAGQMERVTVSLEDRQD